MPIYAYRCAKCGEELEVQQSMSDKPLKRCKSCRGALKRVYHPVGIVLKGPGFYKTDNRSSSKPAFKDTSSESKSSESKSSDTKSSDSKPAAKTDSPKSSSSKPDSSKSGSAASG